MKIINKKEAVTIPFELRDSSNVLIDSAGVLNARISKDNTIFAAVSAPVHLGVTGKYSVSLTADETDAESVELEIVSDQAGETVFFDSKTGCC